MDDPPADQGANAAAGGAGPAAGPVVVAAPAAGSLAFEIGADGIVTVRGAVPDETTRNQWLNQIRIGAQGARVIDELRVDAASPAAAGWAGQLSSLVALMRERRLSGLRVEGDRVLLSGAVSTPAEKSEAEKLIQGQVPAGYRLDSRIAIATPVPGAPPRAAAAGSPSPSPAVTPGQKQDERAPAAADRPASARSDTEKLGQTGVRDGGPADRKPDRKAANCPPQLRSIAQPVYFKTDGATLPPEDRSRLQRLGECLGRSRVRVVGHADPRLTNQYNQQLSERRARAVAEALRAGGVPAAQITVVGAGSVKAGSKDISPQVLQRSRRVDIQIR
jgi:outer membrane protein OmpA-like peptidoglycan-associated protein